MQVLNFYSTVFADQMKRGRKTATIRLGDKRHKYRKNQVVLVTVGYQYSPREKLFHAVIDNVDVKRVKDLSPRDIEHDNPEFRRTEELVHFLEQIYGREVSLEDTVTVVRFSQIVENPPDLQDRLRGRRRRPELGRRPRGRRDAVGRRRRRAGTVRCGSLRRSGALADGRAHVKSTIAQPAGDQRAAAQLARRRWRPAGRRASTRRAPARRARRSAPGRGRAPATARTRQSERAERRDRAPWRRSPGPSGRAPASRSAPSRAR